MRTSYPFGVAFYNNQAGPFGTGPFVQNFAIKPALPDGFILAGEGGAATEERLIVIPFCDGPPGSLFSMRVFYWNHRGGNPDTMLWIGAPLVEVLCVGSTVSGPLMVGGYPNPHTLSAAMCVPDAITLTSGYLGLRGAIFSFGAGSGVPAMVDLEMQGARLISFDFQAVDGNGQPLENVFNMNAYWAKFT